MNGYDGTPIDYSGKQLTIFGRNATLDAKGNGTFFTGNGGLVHGNSSTSLELHEMKLVNGHTISMPGGAIRALQAALKVYTVEFSNNDADYGGAIYASQADVTISDAIFNSNESPSFCTADSPRNAGKRCSQDVFCNLNGGASYHCNAGRNLGGAIYADRGVNMAIYASTFHSNSAAYGAAIHATNGAKLKIVTSTFAQNDVHYGDGIAGCGDNCAGGAIFADNGVIMHIEATQFSPTYAGGPGENDIAQKHNNTIEFFCPNGTVGTPFTMKQGELEAQELPPTKPLVSCGSGHVCNATTAACNVCAACCHNYIANGAPCDQCVKQQCS